ncbi:hypothetical protein pb186bvf_016136 [Paramecium bursaria]
MNVNKMMNNLKAQQRYSKRSKKHRSNHSKCQILKL